MTVTKKRIIFTAVLALFAVYLPAGSAEAVGSAPGVSAKAAVLLEPVTGKVLFEKNAYERRSMASTTKIMTALIACEAGNLDRDIITTPEMVNVEGTSMGLQAGYSVSLETLIFGMMITSGNDAANTIATVLGGTPDGFTKLMNERAAKIGMTQSHFITASGLDDDEHYSTAYDMALLAREAMKNPLLRKAASAKSVTLKYGNPPVPRTLYTHNRMLKEYGGAIGIKTGFTKKSGRCLVSAAQREGVELIAVTLSAPDDWNDHTAMLDYGFAKVKFQTFTTDLSSTTLPVAGGQKATLTLTTESAGAPVIDVSNAKVTKTVTLPRFVYAPVEKGQPLGKITYKIENVTVAESLITAAETVDIKPNENRNTDDVLNWLNILIGVK
ncbi:MAG: D-alanyl-D-alanine carboxypeptidase [Oscillospiraceae bacterium]|nr:D-alanyl-D-alanine carboxypeptidase [Oscillospiraceae bacterium]